MSAAAKQRRIPCGSSRAPGWGWPCRAPLPGASPEVVWVRDAVDSSISPLQEQARKSAPRLRRLLEEVGHGMCCIIGLSRPFFALRIKPGHVVTAEHSRIPLSRSGPYEDCLTRKVKRGDRTSKSTLMTLKRAGANRQRGAPFRQEALFFLLFFKLIRN